MWTMRHGRLIADDAVVVQVDLEADALGAQRTLAFGVLGDVRATAEAVAARLDGTAAAGYRTPEVATAIRERVRWRDVPFVPLERPGRIDPRSLTIALDDLLPAERVVAVDSGNFMGYPSMFLDVPDEFGFCFTQAFQSIGLGLATAIGAALARPDRLPVAALGDGGALMGASELETVVRLGLPMVVVVYDDAAYGAEVHHFGPQGLPLETVRFPETDFASIARGYGFEALTVRAVDDLAPVGGLAGRTAGRAAARRRQGRRRRAVVVARGGVPGALTGRQSMVQLVSARPSGERKKARVTTQTTRRRPGPPRRPGTPAARSAGTPRAAAARTRRARPAHRAASGGWSRSRAGSASRRPRDRDRSGGCAPAARSASDSVSRSLA